MTAVHLLKAHPQMQTGGFTFHLYPYAKEIVSNPNDYPISREELKKFIAGVEEAYPGIRIDTSYLDKLAGHPNLWFLEIL